RKLANVESPQMVEALDAGTLAGAAVDVFEEEPLPADSPMRRCERLLLTPHLAASTAEAQERVALEICGAVRNALVTGDVGGAVNIPGVSGDVLTRYRDLMDLARCLGRLAAPLADGRLRGVELHYGGPDDDAPRPTTLAALEGVLGAIGAAPVTLINAQQLAKERGIEVGRRAGQPLAGFETTIGVAVRTDAGTMIVSGAVVGDRVRGGRIVAIDGFMVDVPAEGCVLVLRNRDVPGVIGRVGSLLGESGINIGAYHQARKSDGGDALAAIVVDHAPDRDALERLAKVPDVTDVRFADLGGAR
ncbi:MAG: NAD(P)-dependent oxidoreductase, partial [Gemmatimonadales bacterium]